MSQPAADAQRTAAAVSDRALADPYALRREDEEAPPPTWRLALRRLGPGMVLAAAIVGSGELIATTTLGAQVGYAALWIIVLSCAIKPVVQAELGRYTIATGNTTLEGFNRMPGPRVVVSWLVWLWAFMVMMTLLQVGGMFGGVAQVLHAVVPALSVNAWVAVILALTLALLLGGGYSRIERFSLVKVALFTLLTVCAAIVLVRQPGFSLAAAAGGLTPVLPAAGLSTAIAVFGITGVGATELVMYPYWCIEKGYARYCGELDGSTAWRGRARGWIRVMHLDIAASLVIYTVATIAFYLLGAGVLHEAGRVPRGDETIAVLSRIYTQTLGDWALWLFYLGAIVTLYGTIFASTAAHARVFADALRVAGVYARDDYARRSFWRRVFVVLLATIPACSYWFIESPVKMVVAGGMAQALMLPLIGIAVIYLRHRHLPPDVRPSVSTTIALWISTIVMLAAALTYLWLALFAGH
jgi:Mn2+/Fe2+ NRAMP family transporter